MKIKYLEKGFSTTNFSDKQHDDFSVAELIVPNEINRLNKNIIAIRNDVERGLPDINIYDRITNKLLGYVEVQGIANFKDVFTYRYNDFLFYERRIKNYDLPTIFIAFDVPTNSYLLASMNMIMNAVETCNDWEQKDRMVGKIVVKRDEKIYHLPLSTFKTYYGMNKLDKFYFINQNV